MHGGCTEDAQRMRGGCTEDAKQLQGGCAADAEQKHSRSTAGAGQMRDGCTAETRGLHGGCRADAGQMHSGCTLDAWQTLEMLWEAGADPAPPRHQREAGPRAGSSGPSSEGAVAGPDLAWPQRMLITEIALQGSSFRF